METGTKSPEIELVQNASEARTGSTAAYDEKSDLSSRFLAGLDPAIAAEPISAKEARKVLWKIDLIILPLIGGSVILSAVDKNILSNAAVLGMKDGTHLTGNQYAWVGSLFFFGYLTFEWPMAYLIQRAPVAKFFAATIALWGVLALCTAATRNFSGLAAVRYIMGGMEAVVYPTCSILTVMWWRTSEQPLRVAFWFNTLSTVFVGLISYGISFANTHLAQWRLLFIVLGAFTLLWAAIVSVFLPDDPTRCWWLSDREKFVALQRVVDNNTGVDCKVLKWYQIKECLLDWKTWLIVIFALAQNISNGGINTFAAIIISGFGYTVRETMLIGIPTGVVGTAYQILLSIPSGKLKNKRCMIIALANVAPITCAALLWKLPRDNKHGLLAAYYCFYTYFAPYVLVTALPMANTSGHTKKVTMNALFFISYSIGNLIGPQTFRSSEAPGYQSGYTAIMVALIVAMLSIATYGLLCARENRRRERAASVEDNDAGGEATSFSDSTDREKRSFRYTY